MERHYLSGSQIRDPDASKAKSKQDLSFWEGSKNEARPHRTAQLPTLAAFPPWGSSEGAGRVTSPGGKCT